MPSSAPCSRQRVIRQLAGAKRLQGGEVVAAGQEDPVGGRVATAADPLLGGEGDLGRLGVQQVSGRRSRARRDLAGLLAQEGAHPGGGVGARGQAQGQHRARDAAAGGRDDTALAANHVAVMRHQLRRPRRRAVEPLEVLRRRQRLVVVELVEDEEARPAVGRGPARAAPESRRSRAARAGARANASPRTLPFARARCPTTSRSRHGRGASSRLPLKNRGVERCFVPGDSRTCPQRSSGRVAAARRDRGAADAVARERCGDEAARLHVFDERSQVRGGVVRRASSAVPSPGGSP